MATETSYRKLTDEEIATLQAQGCSSPNWSKITVEDGFRPIRVRNSHFSGEVQIGNNSGTITTEAGLEKICGIFNAYISDCSIGRDVRIAGVGVHIANYDIEGKVCIENIGLMETTCGSTFGNGVEVEVLNEGGGREVILFNELSAQFAYMMCLHRYRPRLIEKLQQIAKSYSDAIRSDRGTIGEGVIIRSTGEIKNVNIQPAAVIDGAGSLENGTILSSKEAPAKIGRDVIAKNFIIAESSVIDGAAVLTSTYVGQGCRMGRQYSAENSLFFANSEAFHGEACSIFAGPYTVTHHKSTLLIAGLYSFYNAGSGTNQSNHMYKLGPVHEGRLGRGTKTGSFSYMMWPCCVGPFGVVLGKHTGTFDTSDYPFSHHEADASGKCRMIPGLNLITVGTVRDGAKWPQRDRRQGEKRDIISFEVFSPLTVGKMIKASQQLKQLQQDTDRSISEVNVGGAVVKRPILRTGQKFYRTGIEMYLLEKLFNRVEMAIDGGWDKLRDSLAGDNNAVYSRDWVDIGGQIMARKRLLDLEDAIESGRINDSDTLARALHDIEANYGKDEWLWVKRTIGEVMEVELEKCTSADLERLTNEYLKIKRKFITLVIADAEKEFAELSRTGFGQDGEEEDNLKDFTAVRGECEKNGFIRDMRADIVDLEQRVGELLSKLKNL